MPWFVKIEEGVVDKATFDQQIPAHKAYVQGLIARGHEAQTGYWACKGGGMLLFKAASMDEAEAIVAQDPLVQYGCVSYKLYEWCIVVGANVVGANGQE
ncbi:MAG: YciI family protein [Leptolyngbyaceae bacterium]|nr:YciI family protein [Leptolyngbyaceae bacterium]